MTALLKDALKPNLVQTLENTPVLMHGDLLLISPMGGNSVRATKLALKLGDYVITEAGFGSDLGAEKFFDIKCRYAGLSPDCVVVVATVRALKYNGGIPKAELASENVEALQKGIVNLKAHVENMRKFGVPVAVAINRFHTDTEAEIAVVDQCCKEMGVPYALSEVFAKGGEGRHRTCRDGFGRFGKNRGSMVNLNRFTNSSSLSRIKSRQSAKIFMELTGCEYSARPKRLLLKSPIWGLEIFLSAWRRPNTLCLMTRRN